LAQSFADPDHIAAIRKAFESPPAAAPLECEITKVAPSLNFSFRFQGGYSMRVPLSQFQGTGHGWIVLLKVKPETGEPVYLVHTFDLPDIPDTKLLGEVEGGFLAGEGKYHVQAVAEDDLHRVCRAQWDIDAKFNSSERKLKPAMPPGSVAEIASPMASGPSSEAPKISRLTILLHAAPLSPRLSKLQAGDVLMLEGSLSALLNQLPAQSVRLVVFNLEQQRVLLRQDGFTAAGIEDVAKAINEIQLGLVDYKVLQNTAGPIELLTNLIDAELQAPEPPDEVVFLGPRARTHLDIPKDAFGNRRTPMPRFYYVQYWPVLRVFASALSMRNATPAEMSRTAPLPPPYTAPTPIDSIALAIDRLKGNTILVRTPGEFADAIKRITPKR